MGEEVNDTSNSVYENLMKLYLSNFDTQNTTQVSSIIILIITSSFR